MAGDLSPTAAPPGMTPGTAFLVVQRTALFESPWNPRKTYDPVALAELAASIRASGIHVPLLVRPGAKDGTYEIGAGARRFRASALADLLEIPVLVRPMEDDAFLELLVLENNQRADVHPLEEARGYRQLMTSTGWDVGQIAARLGRSDQYVYDRLRLLQLTKDAQRLYLAGRFSLGHAILLSRQSAEVQGRLLDPDDRGMEFRAPFWREEGGHDLFDLPDDAPDPRERDPYHGLVPKSVAEVRAWVDDHVRFAPDAVDVPVLFPDTADNVVHAEEAALRVVNITHSYHLQPDAKDEGGGRVYGPTNWKRAEDQACEHAVLGVIVAGPGRGESFPVCVEKKKCDRHWKAERQQAAKRATALAKGGTSADDYLERQRRADAKRQVERERWEKAAPVLRTAFEERLATLPVTVDGPFGKVLVDRFLVGERPKVATLEELVRAGVQRSVANDLHMIWPDRCMALGKLFGVDVTAILKQAVPPAEGQAAAKAKGKRTKKGGS